MFELYAITDRKMLGNTSEVDAARLCYEGGADVVQLRMKNADGGEMLEVAKEMEALANEYNRFFIVNDRMDIAMLAHADGGTPSIVLHIDSACEEEVGYLIYFFEKACAISGYMLGVNPFDQPGVESYKKNMFALLGKPGYEEARAALEARLSR